MFFVPVGCPCGALCSEWDIYIHDTACLPRGGMSMVHFVPSGICAYMIRHIFPVGCLMVHFAFCSEWDMYIHDATCLPGGMSSGAFCILFRVGHVHT